MAIGLTFIDLQWCYAVDNVDICGYNLYYGDDTLIADVGLSLGYTVTGLTENTEYCFYYKAYDCTGNESEESNTICANTASQYTAMIFKVNASASQFISIGTASSTFTGTINYGDGTIDVYTSEIGPYTHLYSGTSEYTVSVFGDMDIFIHSNTSGLYVSEVLQWGDTKAEDIRIQSSPNLVISATDQPLFTYQWNANSMFLESEMNSDIGWWDVSNLSGMTQFLYNNTIFNQYVDNLDVSNVQFMDNTFFGNIVFNQPINSWQTGNVISMSGMLRGATNFNQPLNLLDTGNVTNMDYMLYDTASFNQDIGDWDISSLETAINFISGDTAFSTTNYNALLTGWSGQTVQSGVTININAYYSSSAKDGRDTLTGGTNQWIIYDLGCDSCDQLATPTLSNDSVELDSITNSWTSSAGAISYDYQYKVSGDTTWITATDETSPSTVSGLTVSQDYEFRVRAVAVLSGNTSEWSTILVQSTLTDYMEITVQYVGADTFTFSSTTIDATIYWGDGNQNTYSGVQSPSHSYAGAGTYSIKIEGTMDIFAPNGISDADDIVNVTRWGNIGITSFSFYECINLTSISASDAPVFVSNYDATHMFYNCGLGNVDFSGWDTSNIINMYGMFERCNSLYTPSFVGWDTSNVVDMSRMFWNFNTEGFQGAGGIGGWDVSSVTAMTATFRHAHLTSAEIAFWDIRNVTDMTDFMTQTLWLPDFLYDAILSGWTTNPPYLQSYVTFTAEDLQYTAVGKPYRDILTDIYNWTIIDNGMAQLDTPTLSAVTATTTSITNSWDVITDALSYEYEYKATADSTWLNASGDTSPSEIGELSDNTSYDFRVRALGTYTGQTSNWSTTLVISTEAGPNALLTSLASFWSHEDAWGSGTLTDSHGSNDGTVDITVIEGVTGAVNNAFDYKLQSSGYATVPDNSTLDLSGAEYSIAYWVNMQTTPTSDRVILGKVAPGSSGYMQYTSIVGGAGGQLNSFNYGLTPTQLILAGGNLPLGSWIHIVETYDGSTRTFYRDGAFSISASTSGTINANALDLWIGRYHANATRYQDMIFDELGLWDVALTSDQVTSLYNGGSGLPYSSFT